VIQLEDLDPELLDQVIRRLLARRQTNLNPAREAAIAEHLSQSAELMEWAEMIARAPVVREMSRLLTAVCIGLEIGYELGGREKQRGGA
jgi:hypothetical protein